MMDENRTEFRMHLIADRVPAFNAKTTMGEMDFPDDYNGKWMVLFSHFADITPVCTTEFMTFATMQDQFKARNCELIVWQRMGWRRRSLANTALIGSCASGRRRSEGYHWQGRRR